MLSAIQSRPRWSQVMQIGLSISGSAAKSCGSNPAGTTRCVCRLVGRERVLHPADRLALRAPLPAGQVVGDLGRRLVVRERRQPGRDRGRGCRRPRPWPTPSECRARAGRGSRVLPGPGVVAVGRVEDAALALGAHPGPRLVRLALRPALGGRGGPSRCAWCGRRSRPRCGTARSPS